MISPYYPQPPPADEYLACPPEMDLRHPDYPGCIAGHAERTGITRPGYRCHGVYRIAAGWEACAEPPGSRRAWLSGYWVYVAGRLILSSAWHTDPANQVPA